MCNNKTTEQKQRKAGGGLRGHQIIDFTDVTKRVACECGKDQQSFANGRGKGQNRQMESCVQRHSCVKNPAPSVENFQCLGNYYRDIQGKVRERPQRG